MVNQPKNENWYWHFIGSANVDILDVAPQRVKCRKTELEQRSAADPGYLGTIGKEVSDYEY